MDYVLSYYQPAPITLYVSTLVIYMAVQRSESDEMGDCFIGATANSIPCFGSHQYKEKVPAKDATECCKVKGGHCFYVKLPLKHSVCVVCQEFMVEHRWLPSPPCDREECSHVPQRYIWFTLSIPNRRIQCLGRSYHDMLHCRSNNTLCSVPEPATDPVFCFRHRYRVHNTTTTGCPASSLDWELARDKKECCVTRRGAAYAKHINKWYIDKAKLHMCEECSDNPPAVTTWSEWSVCPPGSSCSRKRTMQIPYLENMPNHWCVETITTEESANEAVVVVSGHGTVALILAVGGTLIAVILAVVVCVLCFRSRNQARSRDPTPPTKGQSHTARTTDYQTTDGYLIPNSYCPTPKLKPRESIPVDPEEHTYESVDYYSTENKLSASRTASNASYVEMK